MEYTHPQLGPITLAPHPRARRLTLTVRPSGEVRLSFPQRMAEREALRFLEERSAWITQARARMARRMESHPPQSYTAEQIEALRQRAKAELPSRVEALAQKFGFRYGRITIRNARTKWGCCTTRGNLSLSLYLMTLPEHLRDFVLLHELCHTIHHNHSPRFHALLDECLGGRERALQRELKSYHIR